LIHIGYHRTGTSFLQTALFPLIPDCVSTADMHEAERRVADPGLRLAILTNESLSNDLVHDTPDVARELARRFPAARILIGIRSQYSVMRGIYHLHLKTGATESYEAFVKSRCGRLFDYARTIDAYRDAFGLDNVFVLPHEDLVRDPVGCMAAVLRFAGADPGIAGKVVNRQVKPSAGDATMRLLHQRNRIVAPLRRLWPRAHSRIAYYGMPGARLVDRLFGSRLRLPMERVRPLIHAAYADSNARVFASLGLNAANYDYPLPGKA